MGICIIHRYMNYLIKSNLIFEDDFKCPCYSLSNPSIPNNKKFHLNVSKKNKLLYYAFMFFYHVYCQDGFDASTLLFL